MEFIVRLAKVEDLESLRQLNEEFNGVDSSFCYNVTHGEKIEMYVREEYRGNGIGNSLIECLKKELQSREVKGIKILTSIENDAAIKSNTKTGYIVKNEVVFHKKI